MIPDELNDGTSQMLVVDFGRVQLRNVEHDDSFDDVWKLKLSEMQLQNSRFLSSNDPSTRFVNHSNHRTIFAGVRKFQQVLLRVARETALQIRQMSSLMPHCRVWSSI
jgi:hypothetical protein